MGESYNVPLINQIKEANTRFQEIADKTIEEANNLKAVSVDYFHDKDQQTFRLIRGGWVETHPGMRVLLIDEVDSCLKCSSGRCPHIHSGATRCLVEAKNPVHVPLHYHDRLQTITVISGAYKDLYRPEDSPHRRSSEVVIHQPGELHEPELMGLFLVCWSPPLKREY